MKQPPLPPHDIEAEEAVIGSALVDPETLTEMMPILKPADFFREQNRWVYEAAVEIVRADGPKAVSVINVAHRLALKGKLEDVGGPAYLSRVTGTLPTSVGARYYAQIVADCATRRRLISAAGQITRRAHESADVNALLADSASLVSDVVNGGMRVEIPSLAESLQDFWDQPPSHGAGVLTKWPELNEFVGSLRNGNMYVMAANTGRGKTSWLVDLLAAITVQGKRKALFFSIEMGIEAIKTKFVSCVSGVDSVRIEQRNLSDGEQKRINHALGVLGDVEQWIDDRPASVDEISLRAKAHALRFGCDLVAVDYLQLVTAIKGANRTEQVTQIAHGLKRLAKEMDRPVVALAQLNRSSEGNVDQKPELRHLRESGAIEQDADAVFFLWSERRHDARSQRPVELMVAKNRNGPVGKVETTFYPAISRFEEGSNP